MREPPWISALLDRPYTATASRLVDWHLVRMDKYRRQKQRHPPKPK
ncbi:hypothetical protein [Gloeomargarita lithophora]